MIPGAPSIVRSLVVARMPPPPRKFRRIQYYGRPHDDRCGQQPLDCSEGIAAKALALHCAGCAEVAGGRVCERVQRVDGPPLALRYQVPVTRQGEGRRVVAELPTHVRDRLPSLEEQARVRVSQRVRLAIGQPHGTEQLPPLPIPEDVREHRSTVRRLEDDAGRLLPCEHGLGRLQRLPTGQRGDEVLRDLRLHLFMRDVLAVPWAGNGVVIKRELARCVELRRAMMQAGGGYLPTLPK